MRVRNYTSRFSNQAATPSSRFKKQLQHQFVGAVVVGVPLGARILNRIRRLLSSSNHLIASAVVTSTVVAIAASAYTLHMNRTNIQSGESEKQTPSIAGPAELQESQENGQPVKASGGQPETSDVSGSRKVQKPAPLATVPTNPVSGSGPIVDTPPTDEHEDDIKSVRMWSYDVSQDDLDGPICYDTQLFATLLITTPTYTQPLESGLFNAQSGALSTMLPEQRECVVIEIRYEYDKPTNNNPSVHINADGYVDLTVNQNPMISFNSTHSMGHTHIPIDTHSAKQTVAVSYVARYEQVHIHFHDTHQ
jgi:hypothetical protein